MRSNDHEDLNHREIDNEELLWEMGRVLELEGEPHDVDEEDLTAYRTGLLAAPEQQACEASLGQSPRARQRLAELAEVRDTSLPSHHRQRVLAAFDAERSGFVRDVCAGSSSNSKRFSGRFWITATALAAGVLMTVVLPDLRSAIPADLSYDVKVRGVASERSLEAASAEVVEALPETRIEIVATAREAASADVSLALYKPEPGKHWRIFPGPTLTVDKLRGGAVFRFRAADLLGDQPGEHSLLVVAAATDDLPAAVEFERASEATQNLAADGRRLVYPLTFHLGPGSHVPVDRTSILGPGAQGEQRNEALPPDS